MSIDTSAEAGLASGKIMRDKVRQLFPTGRTLAAMLTQVSRGMAADALLSFDAVHAGDESAIVLLPQFSIRDFAGSESLNRVQWAGDDGRATRIVQAGSRSVFEWKVEDSTLDTLSGRISVDFTGLDPVVSGDLPPVLGIANAGNLAGLASERGARLDAAPGEVIVLLGATGAQVTRHLTQVSARGKEQTFYLATLLHPFACAAVNAASYRIHREINGLSATSRATHIVDELERDHLADQLMLGEHNTDSIAIRMIRRVASTDMTVRKSTMTIMSTALWSAAETIIRKHIGDPHLGRVIRRIARDLQGLAADMPTPEEVLDAYKRVHPDARLGLGRVFDALTAGASVHSQAVALPTLNGDRGATVLS